LSIDALAHHWESRGLISPKGEVAAGVKPSLLYHAMSAAYTHLRGRTLRLTPKLLGGIKDIYRE
jgi:hypothetical protein